MIPEFNDAGLLPAGVYPATLAEIESRFCVGSEVRQTQGESIRWLINKAQQAGVARIILNGSFTTDIMEPNDVDCVLLLRPGEIADRQALRESNDGYPFLSIAIEEQREFDRLVHWFFAEDRMGAAKGMVEVLL